MRATKRMARRCQGARTRLRPHGNSGGPRTEGGGRSLERACPARSSRKVTRSGSLSWASGAAWSAISGSGVRGRSWRLGTGLSALRNVQRDPQEAMAEPPFETATTGGSTGQLEQEGSLAGGAGARLPPWSILQPGGHGTPVAQNQEPLAADETTQRLAASSHAVAAFARFGLQFTVIGLIPRLRSHERPVLHHTRSPDGCVSPKRRNIRIWYVPYCSRSEPDGAGTFAPTSRTALPINLIIFS